MVKIVPPGLDPVDCLAERLKEYYDVSEKINRAKVALISRRAEKSQFGN